MSRTHTIEYTCKFSDPSRLHVAAKTGINLWDQGLTGSLPFNGSTGIFRKLINNIRTSSNGLTLVLFEIIPGNFTIQNKGSNSSNVTLKLTNVGSGLILFSGNINGNSTVYPSMTSTSTMNSLPANFEIFLQKTQKSDQIYLTINEFKIRLVVRCNVPVAGEPIEHDTMIPLFKIIPESTVTNVQLNACTTGSSLTVDNGRRTFIELENGQNFNPTQNAVIDDQILLTFWNTTKYITLTASNIGTTTYTI